MTSRPWLSPAGAAAVLGCPLWLVHALIRRGVLSSVRVGGRPRVAKRELETFIAANKPEETS